MFPREMVVLMALEASGDSGKKLLTRPTVAKQEYVDSLYDSLVSRGYLQGNKSRGYQLTLQGREALFEFLLENRTRVQDAIKALRQLGIDSSKEIDQLVKEAIGTQ